MLTWNAAFCDAAVSGPGDLGRWVAAYPEAPDHGTIVFETDTNDADGSVGVDHVAFIRVLSPEADPDWTVSQSDNVAGGCLQGASRTSR